MASSLRLDLIGLLVEVGEQVTVEVGEVLEHPLQDLLGLLALGPNEQRRPLEVRMPEVVTGFDDLLLPLERLDQRDQESLLAARQLDPQ